MPSIAAVVVTFNRKELLLECIECLRAQSLTGAPRAAETQLDILVIDNASTDGTADALQEFIAKNAIRYWNTGANLGGAGGFNFGMRTAVEEGYDYVWVMDDDCMPHPDTLRGFLQADAELKGPYAYTQDNDPFAGRPLDTASPYGYLSSVCRWTDDSICTMNTQRHPLTHNIEDFTPALQPCTLASFVSLFVPASVIRELGLPIKDFFIWSDDWEFTRRISRHYPCYVAGTSVVTHKSKSNGVGNIALDSEAKIDRYRLAYRNDVVFYRREGLRGWGYLIVRGAYHTALVLTKAKSKKLLRWKTIVQGNLEGLRFHPAIEYVSKKG